LTTSVLGPKHIAEQQTLDRYNLHLHELAEKNHLPIALVDEQMKRAFTAGATIIEDDQIHPNLAGQRLIARSVLDALGDSTISLPVEFKPEVMPGIISEWRVWAVPKDQENRAVETAAAITPDEHWVTWKLPETGPEKHPWYEQERRRGFALNLDKAAGKATDYLACAQVHSDSPRQVCFNTGADLKRIWLNGKLIYTSQGWTGWHAGKERIAAQLTAGQNSVTIQTGRQFFLSITDTNDW
jgi:hypothetical protein